MQLQRLRLAIGAVPSLWPGRQKDTQAAGKGKCEYPWDKKWYNLQESMAAVLVIGFFSGRSSKGSVQGRALASVFSRWTAPDKLHTRTHPRWERSLIFIKVAKDGV